jgi:Sulfotransferase domain
LFLRLTDLHRTVNSFFRGRWKPVPGVAANGKRNGDSLLVNFLIAGTQKGGTTALFAYMQSHPDICAANIKETHFFDSDGHFKRKRVNYAALHKHFTPRQGQLLGEATPITMYWETAPRRVWEYNPGMKIICILRDPIDRAFSQWKMYCQMGLETLGFTDALNQEAERCRAALPLQHRIYSYTDRGFYCAQIRRLWRYFPREQTYFLKNEDLRARPQETLDGVFDFLGIRRVPVQPQVIDTSPYTAVMEVADRARLAHLYEYEVRQLERLLDWDCRDWLAVTR